MRILADPGPRKSVATHGEKGARLFFIRGGVPMRWEMLCSSCKGDKKWGWGEKHPSKGKWEGGEASTGSALGGGGGSRKPRSGRQKLDLLESREEGGAGNKTRRLDSGDS